MMIENQFSEKDYGNFQAIKITFNGGVATVQIDNPPVNVLDVKLMSEIRRFLKGIAGDGTIKVVIFESANPDFFIAHVDMALIDEPNAFDGIAAEVPEGQNVFQAFGEMLRQQPQVTIVKLKGMARGGGAEFVTAADMCFAATETAGLAQCEALMGIIPGGGATQFLPLKMTRGRSLEVLLGADLFDADTAAKYGWINRAIPAADIDEFVMRIATHIDSLPEGVIQAAKLALPPENLTEGYQREHAAWAGLFALPAAEKLIRGGLKKGAQTVTGELRLEGLLRDLAREIR